LEFPTYAIEGFLDFLNLGIKNLVVISNKYLEKVIPNLG
jgi:hypothetical protein